MSAVEMKTKTLAQWYRQDFVAEKGAGCGKIRASGGGAPDANTTDLLRRPAMSDPTVQAQPAPVNSGLELALSYLRDGTLSIDDDGRVWRHFILDHEGRRDPIVPRRIDRPTRKGYMAICLRLRGQRKSKSVLAHVLCWNWRHGPIPRPLQVNHKDLNKANNRDENHELVTNAGNARHAYEKGRVHPWAYAQKWRPGIARRTPEQNARVIALRREGKGHREIAAIEGISRAYVALLLKKAGIRG